MNKDHTVDELIKQGKLECCEIVAQFFVCCKTKGNAASNISNRKDVV